MKYVQIEMSWNYNEISILKNVEITSKYWKTLKSVENVESSQNKMKCHSQSLQGWNMSVLFEICWDGLTRYETSWNIWNNSHGVNLVDMGECGWNG